MPEIYYSVRGECVHEKIIEKSRFIGYARHVESEDEARSFIAEVKTLHPTATHHCYGFIADKTGAMQRFSDDNEPQGTAGMPILDVIKNKSLFETAVVVVRYFGGIKLGAGGLVRAYSSTCAETLDKADICTWQMASSYLITVDYPQIDGALKFFERFGVTVKDSVYADKVGYTILVKRTQESTFLDGLTDALLGRVESQKIAEYFDAFSEK